MEINFSTLKLIDLTAEELKALSLNELEQRLAQADRLDTQISQLLPEAIDYKAKRDKESLEAKAIVDKLRELQKGNQSHLCVIKRFIRTQRALG